MTWRAKVTCHTISGVRSDGRRVAVVSSAALSADVGQSSHSAVVTWGEGRCDLDHSVFYFMECMGTLIRVLALIG